MYILRYHVSTPNAITMGGVVLGAMLCRVGMYCYYTSLHVVPIIGAPTTNARELG